MSVLYIFIRIWLVLLWKCLIKLCPPWNCVHRTLLTVNCVQGHSLLIWTWCYYDIPLKSCAQMWKIPFQRKDNISYDKGSFNFFNKIWSFRITMEVLVLLKHGMLTGVLNSYRMWSSPCVITHRPNNKSTSIIHWK